ncbi:PREDICTED: nuclear pore complex protein Nup88 [Nicrophorus vespilloides]|uniref:Nuclear pore complex protein Nup88 n=1 Tax=Nicrophorus vespilloides TaxID=110193 RepID=A0ABM1M717_NICVS|nr:PREDICTED: nuclear pore complex protein Nup88 [Nicrophorus vespilloides]
MSSTDYLRLNEHKIFKNVRETLPEDVDKAKNLMCVRDDVLYTWNYQDNCVLTLNIKAARSRDGDNIVHQTLLPMSAPYFVPDNIIVNNSNTLLAAYGPNGVLVFMLPEQSPPFGLFSGGKEIIYCRTYSLQERALAFSTRVEVRQARFHPGSPQDSHLVFLTSDNIIRIYNIQAKEATCEGVFGVGVKPTASISSSKYSMLETLGETAVDFDFGPPEKSSEAPETKNNSLIRANDRSINVKSNEIPKTKSGEVKWPMYFLYGNGEVYIMTVKLGDKCHPGLKGPHIISPHPDGKYTSDLCSLLCLPSTPPVLCIGSCKGRIYHVLVLPCQYDYGEKKVLSEDVPSYMHNPEKTLCLLETVELELGLGTTHLDVEYNCPIYLHRDYSKLGNYFATHETGVHSISIPCIDILHKFLNVDNDDDVLHDLVEETSSAEYLLCTKTSTSEKKNPVLGFSIYHDPHSFLALLANGQLVSVAILTMILPQQDSDEEDMENMNSPLKNMLLNPFDAQIQRILKQSSTQPILKVSTGSKQTQQECYELLQRASQVFRDEHFKHHDKAREEIEKRVKALRMLKDFQTSEIDRMMGEKQSLQGKAEHLAEKYEDLKEKQEEMIQRCQKMLLMISKRQVEPSNAEKKYMGDLKEYEKRIEKYRGAIEKLRNKCKYQEDRMHNWEMDNKKEYGIGSSQTNMIKSNLQDMTNKIAEMVKEINERKRELSIV